MRERAPRRPAAERKQLILESAQAVFAAAGYANAGTGDVARGAGVSPAAIYRYFPSKRELYLATLRNAGPRLLDLWGERIPVAVDPLEVVRRLGMEYYDHAQGRSSYTRLWFQALGDVTDPEVRDTIAANFLDMLQVISSLIAGAQERGSARPDIDPRIAAWHFMSIGFTFDLVHHLGLDAELDRARVEAWGDLFIESLRKAPDGPAANKTPGTEGRALHLRRTRRANRSERSGDSLQTVQESPPDSVGEHAPGGADD